MTWSIFIMRVFLLALNLHMPVGRKFDQISVVEVTLELTHRKENRKRIAKHYPVKRKRFVKKRIERRFKSTAPKAHRFSNQRTLRRMYRNC